jgi:2,5-diketo-D-gluconate reductase B
MQTKSGKLLYPIGIGTWLIAGSFESKPDERYKGAKPVYGNETQEIEAIQYSLLKGQNHVDCAELYGGFYTDEVVGKAIADVAREDIYVADKLWKSSVGTGLVKPTVEEMLAKLGTDYLDMLYIHNAFDDAPWQEAIPQIDQLIDAGVVRHFGVSNFTVEQMEEAMEITKHPITANQMHYNLLHKDEVDKAFLNFIEQHNIQLVAYQPVKRKEVLANKIVQQIAQKHNVTPAQVALAWLLTKNALPIPKAVQKQHIDDNVAAVDLVLDEDDMKQLEEL